MTRLRILPYAMNSLSSRAISKHFNTKRVYPNRNYRPKDGDVVLNWGFRGVAPVLENSSSNFTLLNKPIAVDRASDKIATLRLLKQNNVAHVKFFLNKDDAIKACEEGNIIYCRTITRGREGKGIVLARKPEEIVDARLYTEYFKNDKEYRIHVFNGKVIDEVQKKSMSSERMAQKGITKTEDSDYIRNLKKAWSFCRQGVVAEDIVKETAIKATEALGLDFAAVDISYNSETDQCAVLELNTAPGQKRPSSTHYSYTKAISEFMGIPYTAKDYKDRYGLDVIELNNRNIQ
jgi:glutathione synthase/RimK-type ligase-like ATP-grasp enzyme